MKIKQPFIPKETALKFKKILKTLISDYYKDVIKKEKEICSFGIFTDSDISSFLMSCNTACKAKNEEDKWWIPEWKAASIKEDDDYYEDERYEQLEKIMNDLIEQSNWDFEEEKNTFASYKNEIFDCMCMALKELKAAKLFEEVSDDFFLLVQESDNGISDERAISLHKIMSKEQFEAYQLHEE